MDLQAQSARWLDLVAELVTVPCASMPHDRLLAELSTSFQSLSSWHFVDADGSFCFDLSHSLPGFGGLELDLWSRANRSAHPLLFWYETTLDPRPMSVERVPRQMVPAGGFELVRELCAPFGIERQLSIPYELTPEGSRSFVLGQSGEDYSDDDIELARIVQPLIALVSRQTTILARGGSARGNPAGLTGRELAVLQLLAEGLTAHGIGHALAISPRTVHTHLAHLYRKLDVSDRLRAVTIADQLGLLNSSAESSAIDERPSQVVYEVPSTGADNHVFAERRSPGRADAPA
jgi:DNA-binding CsgD family transcriptional regulator